MTPRVPSSHVPLTEAVIRATWAWHQDELIAAGVTQEAVTTHLRWFFAFMRVAASRLRPRHEKLKGVPVKFDPADVKAAEETDEVKSIRAKRAFIADKMDAAYGRLRDMLATGHLPGFIVSENGRMHRLEPWRWNGEDADTAHQRGQMRTVTGYEAITGVAAIPRAEFEAALGGAPTMEPSSRPTVPIESQDKVLPQRARPAREWVRVAPALKACFPNGPPGREIMSDAQLTDEVFKQMKAMGMKEPLPSPKTILREAGRIKRTPANKDNSAK